MMQNDDKVQFDDKAHLDDKAQNVNKAQVDVFVHHQYWKHVGFYVPWR